MVDKTHNDHPISRVYLRNYEKKPEAEELKEQVDFVKDVEDYGNDEYGGLIWKSAYNRKGCEPIYTTKTKTFRGTLDYLFYTNVDVVACLEMMFENKMCKNELNVETEAECAEKCDYFPNKYYPSDHIALVADFKL